MRRNGTSSFYGFDMQGAARLLVSLGGAVTDRYTDTAFGEEVSATGATANPFRYGGQTGYYRDTAGRLKARARELDVPGGRWLSRDPIQRLTQPNRYAYVGNSPLRYIDPAGLAEWETGSYWGDVKKAFRAELSVVDPRAWYQGVRGVIEVGRTQGAGAALRAVGEGVFQGYTAWWTSLDLEEKSRSAMTVGLTLAPLGAKGVSTARIRAVLGRLVALKWAQTAMPVCGIRAFGKLAGKPVVVTEKGMATVREYLNRPELGTPYGPTVENTAMLQRLRAELMGDRLLAGADAAFYTHELAEAPLVGKLVEHGMTVDDAINMAHSAAMKDYGIAAEFAHYHPSVIGAHPEAFSDPWFRYWGIQRP